MHVQVAVVSFRECSLAKQSFQKGLGKSKNAKTKTCVRHVFVPDIMEEITVFVKPARVSLAHGKKNCRKNNNHTHTHQTSYYLQSPAPAEQHHHHNHPKHHHYQELCFNSSSYTSAYWSVHRSCLGVWFLADIVTCKQGPNKKRSLLFSVRGDANWKKDPMISWS